MNALSKVIAFSLAIISCGCATKTRNVELDGMYMSETTGLAIGSIDIQAAPTGEETASVKYEEDNAWLQPSMKLHKIKIQLTGTNSTHQVTNIVHDICNSFIQAHSSTQKEEISPANP